MADQHRSVPRHRVRKFLFVYDFSAPRRNEYRHFEGHKNIGNLRTNCPEIADSLAIKGDKANDTNYTMVGFGNFDHTRTRTDTQNSDQ